MADRWLTAAVIGAALAGWAAGNWYGDLAWLATFMTLLKTLFLSVLKMIIAPLIFFSLISGVLRLGAARRMRRLGGVTLLYYLTTTGIAIGIGLTVVTLLQPWTDGPPLLQSTAAGGITYIDLSAGSPGQLLEGLIRTTFVNPFQALADLNILGIVANAIAIGIAGLLVLPRDSALIGAAHDVTQLFYRLARWAIWLVPVGVLAILFELAGQLDEGLVGQLLEFMGVVILATAFHGLLVLPALAWLGTGIAPWTLLRRLAEPMVIALTTSSSAMTLPSSMRTAEEQFGVNPGVASFVLPLGATINMDGTALFEGIAAVFLAYLFGIELGTSGVLVVFFVAMLSSVGAPGIPSGSMAGMQVVLLAVGIPLEAIGLLLLVERPLDTIRTAVNVEGDLIGTLFAQRYGGVDG